MHKQNRILETLVVTFTALLLFTVLSFVNTDFTVAGFKSKKISLFSDIYKPESKNALLEYEKHLIRALKDSFCVILKKKALRLQKNDMIKIRATQGVNEINDFSLDSVGALDKFFRALMQTKKKIRVAYFGDSMIEGDLLTQDFRQSLQKRFGGKGVGFVPVTSIVAGFRRTIIHSFSSNWSDHTLIEPANSLHPLGLSGHVFVPNENSRVTYRAPNYYSQLNSFNRVCLYYGSGSDKNKVNVLLDTISKEFQLSGTNPVNEITLNDSGAIHSVSLSFDCPDLQNIYGLSFEGSNGVQVDNYSFRGNSGLALTKIPYSVFRGFDSYFNYDLIVLHYGLNIVGHDQKDYSWYKKGLENLIDYIKNVFPHASILVVSVNDRSWKSPEGWITEPDIPILVDVQKKAAEEKGVAFWNLYKVMGGYNSMVHWVEGDTVLATNDYAHLNFKGAKKISDLLYKELMIKFDEYEKKNSDAKQ